MGKPSKKPFAVLDLQPHEFSELVPGGLSEEEHAALVEDVRANGIRVPIALYQGRILDGRARYRAAMQAKVECPTEEFNFDDEAARRFVISTNLHRRSLSTLQKALAIAEMYKAAVNSDGPKPSQDTLVKRYGISKGSLSLCLKALDSKNAMLLARLRRGEITRGELEEEFYDRNSANSAEPTGTEVNTGGNDVFSGAAPAPGASASFPPQKRDAVPTSGTRPQHPERRTLETPGSVVAQQYKALSSEERNNFVRLAWPWLEKPVEAHALALATTSKAKGARGTPAATVAPKRKKTPA